MSRRCGSPAAASCRRSGRTEVQAAARVAAVAAVVALVAGCGSPSAPGTLRGAPASYLLTIDDMVSPDFTVDTPAHLLTAADVAAGDAATATRLARAGYDGGAAIAFFREPGNLATVNGPVQVLDTVEQFATAAGAASSYSADIARLDSVAGAAGVSTGALGDAAHATTRTVTDPSTSVALVEITVEWRVENLVDVLVVRGREGGTRPDDAFVLAHRQTAAELGLPTPTPLPTPRPTPTPPPTPRPTATAPAAAPSPPQPS